MSEESQVRFGVVIPRYNIDFGSMCELAKRVEASGYSSLWLTDHLQPPGITGMVHETLTTLAALACEMKQCRLGTMVFCYSYRHPALLASALATVDDISGGRLDVGLGLGSKDQTVETRSLGIAHPMSSQRLEEFREYVQVLKALWTQPQVTYHGTRYHVEGRGVYPCRQKPHPPLWIGARKPRMMQLAASHTDGWNYYGLSVEEYKNAAQLMKEYCLQFGRDPATLKRSFFTGVVIANSEAELKEKIARASRHRSISPDEFLERSCTAVYGTPGECIETVAQLIKEDVDLIILRDYNLKGENIELFSKKVAPHFRSMTPQP
ncbi:MAG: LLM class flavin-dependent oxidoreductase [Candidatus Bathyarchaeia archaeon]